jgi:transcriptional regulator with XRE-family HTH domain
MATLSEILNDKITKGGKSKASVAAHLEVSERTIENYMAGKRQPKPEALGKLANFLGFDLNELYEQSVPRETVNHSTNGSKQAHEAPMSHSQPVQERYIKLLEETVKETKAQRTELQARLDELTGRQADFLARVESLIERYEHLVLAQLQSKGQEVPDSTPTVLQQTYKSQGSLRKKST